MRPLVADFISGFNNGFATSNVNLSVRLQYHRTYLQRREYEHYVTGEVVR